MAGLITNKWTIIVALQKRLDAGLVSKYEAALAIHAIRSLFPGCNSDACVIPSPDALWPMKVHQHLWCLLNGEKWKKGDSEVEWLSVWQGMHGADQFISEQGVQELLDSAARLKGEDHGIQPISASGSSPDDIGEDPRQSDSLDDAGADTGFDRNPRTES